MNRQLRQAVLRMSGRVGYMEKDKKLRCCSMLAALFLAAAEVENCSMFTASRRRARHMCC